MYLIKKSSYYHSCGIAPIILVHNNNEIAKKIIVLHILMLNILHVLLAETLDGLIILDQNIKILLQPARKH